MIKLVEATPDNIDDCGLFCIKNKKEMGYQAKAQWYKTHYATGLQLILAYQEDKNPAGFIEFTPAEEAWRPIEAPGYLFIQCIMVYPNKNRNQKVGTTLLGACELAAENTNKKGIAVMVSKGPWMSNHTLFKENGYSKTDQRGRFELWVHKLDENAPDPKLRNWERQLDDLAGWQLWYADQCPWHDKAAKILQKTALDHGVKLDLTKLETAQQAQAAPSGFGVFSLVKDGKLLEDHYISKRRFESILARELG